MVRAVAGYFYAVLLLPGINVYTASAEAHAAAAYEQVADSVVLVICPSQDPGEHTTGEEYGTSGSGFVIDNGLIITNYHVIANALEIEVYLSDGRGFRASIVGTAPNHDLALLQVPEEFRSLPPVLIGDVGELRLGQQILAVGSPFGLESSVTSGIVSGLNRDLPGTTLGPNLIQFDAPINPGQSGGPLVDLNGAVVGVVTAKIENGEAVGFAIPIDIAVRLIPDLMDMGHPFQAQIGLQGTGVNPGLASLFGLDVDVGFLVEGVEEGSPAAAAGLESGERLVFLRDRIFVTGGDIIVSVNGEALHGGEGLAQHLGGARPGDLLDLEVINQGVKRHVKLVIPSMEHQRERREPN